MAELPLRIRESLQHVTLINIPPEQQAQDAIYKALGNCPDEIIFDREIHRFSVEGDKGTEKSGWYCFGSNGRPGGCFGTWRDGERRHWYADMYEKQLTPAERTELEATYKEAREKSARELKALHERIAGVCREMWSGLPGADDTHPYLQRKKVKSHGLRQLVTGKLVVPVYIGDGLSSLQFINGDGRKEFQSGGAVSGGYYHIPAEPGAPETQFVVEGYATGASVFEATGCSTWIAFNAGNMSKVGLYLRERMPAAEIVFVGDNDVTRTGQEAATTAADAINGKAIIVPVANMDANDYASAGHDLRELLLGEPKHWLKHYREFCSKPQPIRWLIKHWLQDNAIMMIFGPSGSGKTFVALDMALHVASSELNDWYGSKVVKHGRVVYLAGEGYAGLQSRMVGWATNHGIKEPDVYVSEKSVDLDTGNGLTEAINEIHSLDIEPVIIVVDTLNRFIAGDENKAQDVKVMLDSCAILQREFKCAIFIVHHTGVGQETQNRARGSSAWKGAMDIELLVKPEGDYCISLNQTKNKDSECQAPQKFELMSVDVPGWFDEEGEQITTKVITPWRGVEIDEESTKVEKLTKCQMLLLGAYDDAARKHGKLDESGKFIGVSRDDLRAAFYDVYPNENESSRRSAFNRALYELVEGEKLVLGENGLYSLGGLEGSLKGQAFAKALAQGEV